MSAERTRRLIVGVGGSGRTHLLREWADSMERRIDGTVTWIRGSVDHRSRANASRRLLETLHSVDAAGALAVDDAHWLPDDVVEKINDLAEQVPVAVARSPWPTSSTLRELDDALTIHDEADRLGALDDDALERVLHQLLADDDIDRRELLELTAGSIGLVRLFVDSDMTTASSGESGLPTEVVDGVLRRARASGSDVVEALRAMALGADLATAAGLVGDDTDGTIADSGDLERRLRSCGLVVGDRLIALAADAVDADMTDSDRAQASRRVTGAIEALHPVDRARLIERSGDTHLPEERAAAAVFLGTENAAERVGALGDLTTPDAVRSAFVLDMRAMRWDRASRRELDRDAGAAPTLSALAAVLGGIQAPAIADASSSTSVDHQVAADLHRLIHVFASGDHERVGELGTRVVDDAIAARLDLSAGWSPAAIAGALMTSAGQPEAARTMLRAAIAADLGGPGEQPVHHLLAAHADIACGDFSAALDLVRAGARPEWSHRDHFLLAALDAAIARRSGDTTRLRDAWKRSAPIIDRQSLTWLLLDPVIEVLAAGARVGASASIERARSQLAGQTDQWPEHGPAPAMIAWADLQLAIASEDWLAVDAAASRLSATSSADARTTARRSAAAIWSAVARRLGAIESGNASDLDSLDGLEQAVGALVAVGDAWEASRLLGQAALDHPDPTVARSLLEHARMLVSDPVEAADGLLAAGLSEREAEVARLVVEGRTYKAIGGQLFISAKTVEHHVARIRQRLGAGSRAELLALIRELAGTP